jgi:phage terminase Nu1 subunit (DNA packaging protein)
MAKKAESAKELQGWGEIAEFLGLPVATAQRWQKSGMPVRRGGRYVYANPEELNRWLNRESPSRFPTHIATTNEDLAADLKQALAQAQSKGKRSRKAA